MRNAEQLTTEYNALPIIVAHQGTGVRAFFVGISNKRKINNMKKQLRSFLEYSYGNDLSSAAKNIVWQKACKAASYVSPEDVFEVIQNDYIQIIETAGDFLVSPRFARNFA
jgi:hypothetical protein